MDATAEVVAPIQAVSPLEAFEGTISRSGINPLYMTGLAIVALGMVLLPVIYLLLIALTAWGVLLHLRYDMWIFDDSNGRAGFIKLLLYLGPAVAGAILIFFMVKPFFAKKVKSSDPVTLDPQKESLLFAFVQKICRTIGAPLPSRIDVDCNVNASASLQSGILSKDLVLTIGLPLASGLTMREFAGVLAHEFGHFAQGAGMRLTYVIRRVNFWFARVVFERDEWDFKLAQAARNADVRIGFMLHLARGCVWLTRRILWALMHLGHGISCFMLRQMEYDADSYETRLAGTDAFETTVSRLHALNAASQAAYEDVRQSWESKRLPENLPLLIGHKAGFISPEALEKLSSSVAARKTKWFDTHPCDSDRVRHARRLNQPGIFRLCEPATRLFSDFEATSKTVTRHQYEKDFRLEFADENLMSAEVILRESSASAEAEAMVRKYYGAVNISIKPLLPSGGLVVITAEETARDGWFKTREKSDELRADAETGSAEWIEQQKRMGRLAAAEVLAKAGFRFKPEDFGLSETVVMPADQEIAARFAMQELTPMLALSYGKLEAFMTSMAQRITLGLRAALSEGSVKEGTATGEVLKIAKLLAAVGAEMPRLHIMGPKLEIFVLLLRSRQNHPSPAKVDQIISGIANELKTLINGIQDRLKAVPFPFEHARGKLTVAEYARAEQGAESEWQQLYFESRAHVDRLFSLHYRLVGKFLALFDAVEKELEE